MEDGATVPIFYEPRIVKLAINEVGLAEAARKVAEVAKADQEGKDSEEDVQVA